MRSWPASNGMSNLLPKAEKDSILRLYRKRFLALVFLSIMGLVVAGAALLFPSFVVLKSDEALLTSKRDTLGSHETTQIASTLASTIADINKRLAVFPNKVVPSPLLAQFVDPVLKVKTDAVHITNFTYTQDPKRAVDNIQVSGTTNSRADLLSFADKIKAVDGFTNVTVPIASFIKDSNVTFTISAVITPPK